MILSEHKKIKLLARDLLVGYDSKVALNIKSLQCEGNIIALVGPNGSGKSTFMKTLLNLLIPQRGELRAWYLRDELSAQKLLIPERDVAYSPEENAIFSDITVEDYLQLWCRLKLSNPYYYREEGIIYLEDFDLSTLLQKKGRELSKGQRRRLQAALGFIIQPKLFLLDEPFDGLDACQSEKLIEQMYAHADETGLLISTHRLDIVQVLADTVLTLGNLECSVKVRG